MSAATENSETVELRVEGEWHSFEAGVLKRDDGAVEIAPVSDQIGVESWGIVVQLEATSVEGGYYTWAQNDLDTRDGQVVTLVPTKGGDAF